MTLRTRRTVLATLAATAAAWPILADPAGPGAMDDDIDLLRRIHETLHPGLYRYQTPAQFAARCEQAKASVRDDSSLAGRYLALSRLLATVRCGHSYANFFNQSKAVSDHLFAPANKLPFHFRWIRDRLVVTDNPLGIDGLARGDEILAIDGAPAADVQARLLPYVRADGGNDDKRRALLDVTGGDRIQTFDVFHPLLFPTDRARFTLRVRQAQAPRIRTVSVAPIDQAAREAMAGKRDDDGSPDYWSLAWPKPAVAVITMPGWAMYRVKWDWRARIAAMFEEIARRGAAGLIVDLRDNEGGYDCGNEIVARLIDADLPLLAGGERRVRFRSTPADLTPYLDTWDRSFEHLGEGAEDLHDGFFRLKSDDAELRRIAPAAPRFKGRVIVLSGAQNSSATFQFIDLVRRNGLARVYGQPTGGNQRGINGGSFFFVRLPHSGLEADLPLVGFFPDGPRPDRGLDPDVRIDPTVEDIAAGYDRAMERAVADLS